MKTRIGILGLLLVLSSQPPTAQAKDNFIGDPGAWVFQTASGNIACVGNNSDGGYWYSTEATAVYTNYGATGNFVIHCGGSQGFPAGRIIRLTAANTGLTCGYELTYLVDGLCAFQVSTNWQQTISPSGQVAYDCTVTRNDPIMTYPCHCGCQ
jgi:hypothetical protein